MTDLGFWVRILTLVAFDSTTFQLKIKGKLKR